jgi:hypothetical protein
MTITEILNVIHEERVELEIFKALSSWMAENCKVTFEGLYSEQEIIDKINGKWNGRYR